jgi:hypothetical protein
MFISNQRNARAIASPEVSVHNVANSSPPERKTASLWRAQDSPDFLMQHVHNQLCHRNVFRNV